MGLCQHPVKCGSGRSRTYDTAGMNRLLYQLSYAALKICHAPIIESVNKSTAEFKIYASAFDSGWSVIASEAKRSPG